MPDPVERRYWDTCCFTALVTNEEPTHVQNCRGLLQEAEQGSHLAVTSAFTIPELTRQNGRVLYELRDFLSDYFENDYFMIVPVDRFLAREARELIWTHSLKPPDAVQLATALRTRCTKLYSYDNHLLNLASEYRGRIEICEPLYVGQPTLPEMASYLSPK